MMPVHLEQRPASASYLAENVTQKLEPSCYIFGEMAGRPNRVETLLLDYVGRKPDPVIDTTADRLAIETAAAKAGLDKIDLYGAVERLVRKQYLHKLQNGTYIVREKPMSTPRLWSLDPVAEAVLSPLQADYYISWHAALWHYNLIDQQSRRICVAVRRRKRPVVIGHSRLEFILVSERRFFEHPVVVDDGVEWPVRMATPARAIIDGFDRPALVGPPPVIVDALRRAWRDRKLTGEELVAETLRLESPTLNRRIGFFMDLLEIPGNEPLALRVGRGYAEPLFPGREPRRKLEVDPRWRVYRDPGIIMTALELK